MTTTPDTTVCPTPTKSRFATREAAEASARRSQLSVGKLLTPYECDRECGWWHLTSKAARRELTPADVAAVHALDDEAFQQLVIADARYRAPRIPAMALRDASLTHRWIQELKVVQRGLVVQLRDRAGHKDHDTRVWRDEVLLLQAAVSARRSEAAQIIARRGACVPVPGTDKTERDLREAAGELAVNRLIEAHRREFTELLVEEYVRIGAAIPARIKRYQQAHGIPDPEPPT